jgi:hypothetical protein
VGGLATDRNAVRFLGSERSPTGLCLVGPVSLFGNLEPRAALDSCLQNVWAVPFWSVTTADVIERNGETYE